MRRILAVGIAILALASCGTVAAPPSSAQTPKPVAVQGDWLQFDGDGEHAGVNGTETQITLGNVGTLHQLWSAKLPDHADSTPVLIGSLALPQGKMGAVLYVTTLHGKLLALDANSGAIYWQAAPPGVKLTNSSPAIDPSKQYVYSYGLDGKVHKYATATGKEVTSNGWPLAITLMTDVEKESSALTIANGRLYVTTSGYIGDQGHYEGHVVSMPLAGGTPTIWNSLCGDKTTLLSPQKGQPNYCSQVQSGIWARAGLVADPVTNTVDVVTGNGDYNPSAHDWGDTVIALSPDLSQIVDTYTPANYQKLDDTDLDLGSTTPALLPRIPTSTTPLLAVLGGKDNTLRVLNRQNLSGQGGPGHVGGEVASLPTPGSCVMRTQPAVWTDASGATWVFVTDECGTAGYQVVTDGTGKTTLQQRWHNGQGATSPIVANGVLFAATSGKIIAWNPQTGAQVWSSVQASAKGTIGTVHWESPIVAAGHVYMTDEDNNIYAFGVWQFHLAHTPLGYGIMKK